MEVRNWMNKTPAIGINSCTYSKIESQNCPPKHTIAEEQGPSYSDTESGECREL